MRCFVLALRLIYRRNTRCYLSSGLSVFAFTCVIKSLLLCTFKGSRCEDIRLAVQRVDVCLGTQLDVHQKSPSEQKHPGP